MAHELANRAGDQCPEDECDHTLRYRDYGRPDDVEPEGPVEEVDCPVHGIVESR